MRALIVGAGLGGLCLAHGLRQAGIQVQVLERHADPHAQPASYGIHLNGDGLRALHACLPPANWKQLVGHTVPALDIIRFQDEQLKTLAVRDNERSADSTNPITRRRAVRRQALHDALLLGLNTATTHHDDTIQWGRQFAEFHNIDDGRVQATCTDGSTYTADLIIGADGSNSRVRAQRLPGLDRQDLHILNVAGRIELTDEVRRHLPTQLIDGSINNIVPAHPGWMFVSTWDGGDDTGDGFAVWAWAADRASYPDDIESHSPAQLQDLIAGKVAKWSPAVRYLVAHTAPATIATVPLRSMPHLPAWEPSQVTLLGDAIHNMTPMAGIGANTALRDADELRRAFLGLTAATPTDREIAGRVGAYETRMQTYANQALALSTRNARSAASPARLPRLVFRTVLRVAEAVPPVKRRMFGSPAPAAADD